MLILQKNLRAILPAGDTSVPARYLGRLRVEKNVVTQAQKHIV